MGQISTVPVVKAQVVSQLTTALATASTSGGQVPVTWAWPGPSAQHEAVFLGRHPDLDDIRLDVIHEFPTVKAARKQRSETYQLPMTIWTFRPELSADGAQECEERAFELLDPVEDVFADDPTIGLSPTVVNWVRVAEIASTLWPIQKGWACELIVQLEVQARLQ